MIKGDVANKVRKDVKIKCCGCDVFLCLRLYYGKLKKKNRNSATTTKNNNKSKI
jgi:hypothetical protein